MNVHRTHKDTNPLSFSSEAMLQQAIAGLFARMPAVSGVQMLHGAQEYGKDLVFKYTGPMGESIPCAAVVKNTKISGRMGATGSVRALFDQIEQSIDTPYNDGSGQSIQVERVYVMTPLPIPTSTMSAIVGKLKSRSGQVVFVDGVALFRLFRTFWPDFLADEANALEQVLAHVSSLDKHTEVTLEHLSIQYSLDSDAERGAKIYVSQGFSRMFQRFALNHSLRDMLPHRDDIGRVSGGMWIPSPITKVTLQRITAC